MDMYNKVGIDCGRGCRLGGGEQRGKNWDNCNRTIKYLIKKILKKPLQSCLTSVAPLAECCPIKQKVTDLIPGRGTCLGCGLSLLGCMREAADHCCLTQ